MTTDRTNFNEKIISEFRENAGKVGGMFESIPMLLLHTKGAKSGAERVNPLAFQPLESGWAVFASKGGAPSHPDWYHNVVAQPEVTIEVGTETLAARASRPAPSASTSGRRRRPALRSSRSTRRPQGSARSR